jgi:DNA-binding CsgD family transcriptional regulator
VNQDTRLIGRATELARLDAALRRGQAGLPSLVLIAGEAGIGKSRLLAEFLERARAQDAAVMVGACVPMVELHLPYAPVLDALRGLVLAGSSRCPPDLLRPVATELVDLADARASTPPEDQAHLFRLFLTAVGKLAENGTVVLAIEDLHWADLSTISLLGFLHRRLRGDPVVVVATYRDEELAGHPARDWLAEAVRLDSTVHVRLPRFGRVDAVAHLAEVTGAQPDNDLVDAVLARSAGNPLYAELLVDGGAGRGPIDAGAGRGPIDAGPGAAEPLPDTISELALRRFRWLSPRARTIVQMASVGWPGVRHEVLHDLAGGSEVDLAEALREATEYHLLVADPDTDVYSFAHVVMREAVYGDLLPAARRRWHRRIGELLATHPEWAASDVHRETAYHARVTGNDAVALAAGTRAGFAAVASGAFAEGYAQFRCVLRRWDRVPDAARLAGADRAALLGATAAAAHVLGRDESAAGLAAAALESVGDVEPARIATMCERLGGYLATAARPACAQAAYRRGLAVAATAGADTMAAPVQARLTAGLATLAAGWSRLTDAHRYAEAALALARGAGAAAPALAHGAGAAGERSAAEALARHALGVARVLAGRPADGLRELRAALDAYRSGTVLDVDADLAAHHDLGWCLIRCGRADEALTVSLRAIDAARAAGRGRQAGGLLLCSAAEAAIALGRWPEAHAWLVEAAAGGLCGWRELPLHLVSARLAVARGDRADAARHLDLAGRLLHPGTAPPRARWQLAAETAESAAWLGDLEAATAVIDDGLAAVSGTEEEPLAGKLYAVGLRVAADVAVRTRAHRSDPAPLLARVEALLDRSRKLADLPELAAFAALAEAEAARAHADSGAPGFWRAALHAWDDLADPYAAAYAGFRLAEAMVATASPEPPHAVLRTAWRRAADLEAAPLRAELDALARSHRVRVAEPTGGAPAEAGTGSVDMRLTRREFEVLHRLAAGESNGDIAAALFISTKTASVHVSNILRKLGAANRRDAARAARVLGLTGPPTVRSQSG